VIITDIKLPAREPQGLVLAQMIKNNRRHAPIILMTVHNGGRPREDHEESREPGADVPRVPCLGLRKYYKWF
jgi:CheY-like chemotaxis protein